MKRNSIFFRLTILLFFVFVINVQGQSFEEENAKELSRMDTESFKGKVVLNKAIALNDHLEIFRNREKNKESAYQIHIEPRLMFDLMDMAEQCHLQFRQV